MPTLGNITFSEAHKLAPKDTPQGSNRTQQKLNGLQKEKECSKRPTRFKKAQNVSNRPKLAKRRKLAFKGSAQRPKLISKSQKLASNWFQKVQTGSGSKAQKGTKRPKAQKLVSSWRQKIQVDLAAKPQNAKVVTEREESIAGSCGGC